jgi:uncharacterized membrane protein YfcA
MDLFAGSNDLGTLGLGLVMAGVVSGLVAGLTGMGAGIVIVPALYLVLASAGVFDSLRMHLAVGTALASLIPIAIASWRMHAPNTDVALVKRWILPVAIGVAVGTLASAYMPSPILALLFAALALASIPYLAFGERWRVAAEPPQSMPGALLAFGIGILGTMTAIGFDRIGLRVCSAAEQRTAGTAAVFATVIAVGGSLGAVVAGWQHAHLPMWSLGYVNLMALGILAPVSLGAWAFGAHFTDAVDTKRLRPIVALLIAAIALKIIWDVVGR